MKILPTINPDTIVLIKHIVLGLLVISGVGLTLTAVWHGTRVESLTFTTVVIDGGETIEHSKVEEKVQQVLNGEYLGLVPYRFAWSYPRMAIIESVQTVERIHNIKLDRVDGKTLRVTFDEYSPFALWCDSIESDKCLFLDKEGYAFGEAPNLSGGTFVRFVTSGEEAVTRQVFSELESFQSLLELKRLLAEHGWYVSHIELDQVGDAFLSLVGGGDLKVTVSTPPKQTVDNLFVVLVSENFSHIEPGNFQYVDLRFGNKVFVNEEKESTISEEDIALDFASTTVIEN